MCLIIGSVVAISCRYVVAASSFLYSRIKNEKTPLMPTSTLPRDMYRLRRGLHGDSV